MSTPIAFCDLTPALAPIRKDIDAAIQRVIESGWYLRGRETAAFEEEWAAYCGQAYCVTCNSGTDALSLAALALNREVARVQANTLPLTAIGLHLGGARITIDEVGSDGRLANVEPTSVPVLLFGRPPSDIEASCDLFDAAHAHGWRPPPQAAACWSFYPTKTLGALGDGGAVTTNDPDLAAAMRDLSGRDDRFYSGRQITSRMDEIQAAVLRVKLRHLDAWLDDRRAIAARYRRQLPDGVRMVSDGPGDLHHLLVVQTQDRSALALALAAAGIATKIHFPVPLHHLSAEWSLPSATLPAAEYWCRTILSLPCYPGLSTSDIDRICAVIQDHDAGLLRAPVAG